MSENPKFKTKQVPLFFADLSGVVHRWAQQFSPALIERFESERVVPCSHKVYAFVKFINIHGLQTSE